MLSISLDENAPWKPRGHLCLSLGYVQPREKEPREESANSVDFGWLNNKKASEQNRRTTHPRFVAWCQTRPSSHHPRKKGSKTSTGENKGSCPCFRVLAFSCSFPQISPLSQHPHSFVHRWRHFLHSTCPRFALSLPSISPE